MDGQGAGRFAISLLEKGKPGLGGWGRLRWTN
jgi:hypothetical protein